MCEPEDDRPTILDYLNGDCWRAILNFVPINDIIRLERVCEHWQNLMLLYLRGSYIGIEHPYPSLGSNKLKRRVSWLLVRDHKPHASLELWTAKLGPSVASAFCDTEQALRIIGENCPNLEAVKFIDLPDQMLRRYRYENFRWLRRVCFIKCPTVTDLCVREYANSARLEELEIHHNKNFTGKCLTQIKPNLKSLVLNKCKLLDTRLLHAGLNRFTDLRKLVLNLTTDLFGLYKDMADSIGALQKLEYLDVYYHNILLFINPYIYIGSEYLIDAVCRLKKLKHLGGEVIRTDEQLERVISSCGELRSLDLENSHGVTSRGVAILCREARLTSLGFHKCRLSEEDIVACVYACPDLRKLDVRRNQLTCAIIHRVAAARLSHGVRRPLHFCIDNILLDLRQNGDLDKYEQLILHF